MLRHLGRYEVDGLIAPLLLLGTLPLARFFGALVEYFDWCERPYGELVGGVSAFSFAIGFAISGLRQTNPFGKIGAVLTLLVIVVVPLLFPAVSS